MLLQFTFKNCKSFRDETTLDMTAAKITEFDSHVVKIGREKVLPVAALYGANASGKSNVIDAIRCMRDYVMNSLHFGEEAADGEEKDGDTVLRYVLPFVFDSKSADSRVVFEAYFTASEDEKGKVYDYGFAVDARGVCEEWLNICAQTAEGKSKRVFYRDRESGELDLSGISTKQQRENLTAGLNKETLVVSLGAKIKVEILKLVRDFFVGVRVADFGSPEENFLLSRKVPIGFSSDETVRRNVVEYLSSFDTSIKRLDVKDVEEKDGQKNLEIYSIHNMTDSKDQVAFSLRMESAGTQKMFTLYPLLKYVFDNGGVLVIDELNARLHPLLVRNIILTFLNGEINTKHAQLIFSTHDTWFMNCDLLRRDEIWFIEKADNGVSSMYSLADFVDNDGEKIRKDENYEKNYVLGKYGAIPKLTGFDVFKKKDDKVE